MQRFSRAGLVFEVSDGGPPGGEPVVLLTGFPQDPTSFAAVLPELWAAGLRTLVPEQRGYCGTARPAGRAAYRLAECAADVLALLDAAGLRSAHLVGHDWGGAVAWLLAHRHPDRVRSVVVLSTPHPRAMAAAMLRGRQALRSAYIGFFLLPWLPERVLPRLLPRALAGTGLPAAAARRYLDRLREAGALTAALNWYRALPWSLSTPVGRVRVRTSYAWGRYDRFLDRAAAERTGRYVDGGYRFEVFDAGHWLPETRPAQVAALIVATAAG